MELLMSTPFVIPSPSHDSSRGPDPAPAGAVACALVEEALVVDARAGLSPAQMVERKLASLLKNHPLPVSHMMTSRRTSRNP